jgi:dTDP-4-dehydrorhamnose 3,5-epimerase
VIQLSLDGAWLMEPKVICDVRGSFCEVFRNSVVHERSGRSLQIAQVSCSVSKQGVIRGIHYTDGQPGQDKYVTCVYGAVLDVAVDLRVGSPTYGRWEAYQLDDVTHRAAYITAGLGHGFAVLSAEATLLYLCSSEYVMGQERCVSPFDVELAITWPPSQERIVSDRDGSAPALAEARRLGQLPLYGNFPAKDDPSCDGL